MDDQCLTFLLRNTEAFKIHLPLLFYRIGSNNLTPNARQHENRSGQPERVKAAVAHILKGRSDNVLQGFTGFSWTLHQAAPDFHGANDRIAA